MPTIELLQHLPAMTPDEAESWIAAALAESKALRRHDQRLYPLTESPAAMETARHLHAAWKRWSEDAADLIARIRVEISERNLPGIDELRLAVAYGRGVTAITPEEILRRHLRIESGEDKTLTIEEVRRELGLGLRARR